MMRLCPDPVCALAMLSLCRTLSSSRHCRRSISGLFLGILDQRYVSRGIGGVYALFPPSLSSPLPPLPFSPPFLLLPPPLFPQALPNARLTVLHWPSMAPCPATNRACTYLGYAHVPPTRLRLARTQMRTTTPR